MNKKNVLIVLGGVLILIVSAVVFMGMNTPEKKVEQLKQNIESKKESSGYNKCVERLEARKKTNDECIANKIKELGYTDGLDCISESENPICNDKRYNAQVSADNDCGELVFNGEEFKDVKNISLVECMSLLNK